MKTLVGIVIALLFGVGIWQGVGVYQSASDVESIAGDSMLEHSLKHLDPEYVCPMHPSVVSDKPGSCPICGMDLEQRKMEVLGGGGVIVSAAMQRSLGVVTAMVEYGPVAEEVYGFGEVVMVNPAISYSLESTANGEVHKVLVKNGDWVEVNTPILVINSKKYTVLREAFLLAHEQRDRSLLNKQVKKLLKFGIPTNILGHPFTHGVPPIPKHLEIRAKQSGKVGEIHVSEGDTIERNASLVEFTAPDLAKVEYRSYSRRAHGIKVGNNAHIEMADLPGRTWLGSVIRVVRSGADYFTTVDVQYEIPNELVSIGTLVGAFIEAGASKNVLRIPASAVIYSDRSTRVIRKHERGHFVVVDVEIGFEGTEWIEIISGLREGGRVVTRGHFMIDSEASMRAGLERLKEVDEDL